MKSIVITPKTRTELDLLSALLKKLNIEAAYINPEEKEDLGLKILMRQSDRKKIVPKSKVIRKLKSA
ncbi:MAG: hypothetical protein J0M37_03510 [Ignavibacteria bacterium]|jgi:hypothetical protein|nr:hypothetical protein [Ignavibacteriaceae bacterium]MBN8584136.1 hypothetical protein [Ignavibacteria bacterium]